MKCVTQQCWGRDMGTVSDVSKTGLSTTPIHLAHLGVLVSAELHFGQRGCHPAQSVWAVFVNEPGRVRTIENACGYSDQVSGVVTRL